MRSWAGELSKITICGPHPPPPGFFVSVASKRLSVPVSGLESTLASTPISVDSKGTYVALELCKCFVCLPVGDRRYTLVS
jgi:hypothetical protein